jgi:ABC-type Zn uptake system ZnuABC Zn-binding protein ZnuA
VADADMVFAVGLSMEEYLPALVAAAGEQTEVVSLAEAAGTDAEAGGHPLVSEAGTADPHVWLNPNAVITWLTHAANALSTYDPAGAAGYSKRAAELTHRLLALDAEIATDLAGIPSERRLLVTDHVAWTHFAERYGFEIVGTVASGPTTTVEPTAKNLAHLSDTMHARDIDTIFVTAGEENRSAALLAADVGAEVVPLYVESLGPTGSGAETYETMMRLNAQRIADALTR